MSEKIAPKRIYRDLYRRDLYLTLARLGPFVRCRSRSFGPISERSCIGKNLYLSDLYRRELYRIKFTEICTREIRTVLLRVSTRSFYVSGCTTASSVAYVTLHRSRPRVLHFHGACIGEKLCRREFVPLRFVPEKIVPERIVLSFCS